MLQWLFGGPNLSLLDYLNLSLIQFINYQAIYSKHNGHKKDSSNLLPTRTCMYALEAENPDNNLDSSYSKYSKSFVCLILGPIDNPFAPLNLSRRDFES